MNLVSAKFLPMIAAMAMSALIGCAEEETTTPNPVELKNHSATPALVKGLPSGVEIFSLLSSEDVLAHADPSKTFVFGGSADGAGLLKGSDGSFIFVVNHEDNFAVSRIKLDNTFKPVSGEYIVTSDKGQWRLCSATLVTPEEHGFGPTFLTCGESVEESMVHEVNPYGAPNSSRTLPAFGHFIGENAMPLPKDAYAGKTVILMTDDDFTGVGGGQVFLYVANTVGDLDNGTTYMLARKNDNERETDMKFGQSYEVEFRKVDNIKTLTGKEINEQVVPALHGIRFGRVEDVDYRKGGTGRELYFVTTGQSYSGVNADSSRTKYGRAYKLLLDASDPTKGTLECILDGDDRTGPVGKFQDPDNVCATTNYVYFQEDPNGYGDESHDAYIYQYNYATKEVKVVMELDHRRGDPKYNVGGDSKFGSWEYGALIDVSTQLGIDNTFMLCVQPHTWKDARFKGVDGGTLRANEDQGSQILIIKGLPR